MQDELDLTPLSEFLLQIPAIYPSISISKDESQRWSVSFRIDTDHPLAWRVVQELSNVVNLLSNEERLPTIFYPISPPPYMNGGPKEYLSWIIQCGDPEFLPLDLVEWLEARLPNPVNDEYEWNIEDEDEEE